MGFSTENNASGSSANGSKGFKPADRFLNMSITGLDGKPVKVGFIGLHIDVPAEKAIIDYIESSASVLAAPGERFKGLTEPAIQEMLISDVLGAITGDYKSAASKKTFAGFKFA